MVRSLAASLLVVAALAAAAAVEGRIVHPLVYVQESGGRGLVAGSDHGSNRRSVIGGSNAGADAVHPDVYVLKRVGGSDVSDKVINAETFFPKSNGRFLTGGSNSRGEAVHFPKSYALPIIRGAGGRLDGRRLTGSPVSVCQKVHYKKMCTTLTTLPGVRTPQALLEASVRVASSKAKMAEKKVASAMASSRGNGVMESSLQACMDSYSSLVDSLGATGKMLKTGDSHDNIMSQLSAAGTFATDCDDVFEERPELKSPVAGTQRYVGRLVTNSLEIAATINH